MMKIDAIRTKDDHDAALRKIERLWDAARNTKAGDCLDMLVTLGETYESRHCPIACLHPEECMGWDMTSA